MERVLEELTKRILNLERRVQHLEALEYVAHAGNADRIAGRPVADIEPQGGQVLRWNATNQRWEPSN
jgi:hypothetical protein